MVERRLPKPVFAGSIPVSRSTLTALPLQGCFFIPLPSLCLHKRRKGTKNNVLRSSARL